jgi:hypothetical protein
VYNTNGKFFIAGGGAALASELFCLEKVAIDGDARFNFRD